MITATQLRKLMTATPFRPFRVHLSDGFHYDIAHHDMALVEQNTLDIGLNPDANGVVEELARRSTPHITRLEDIRTGVAA